MQIIKAEHLGMCFGVRDAIALATKTVQERPLTILGELVHNENVLANLRGQGIELTRDLQEVTTSTVMITAHGASDRLHEEVRQRGHEVLEATCPLVHHAHRSLARLVAEGCYPVVIGQRNHVEVRGLTEDLAEVTVILGETDLDELPVCARYGVVSQTTQPSDRVARLVQALRWRFPQAEVRFIDTVCQPTKQRQQAAIDLAQRCDVVLVIGGAHSNNTRELVATCGRHCARVHHLQAAADLRVEWFRPDDTVGLTAGTSTPDSVIVEVEKQLHRFTNQPRTPNPSQPHELAPVFSTQP